MLRRAVFFDRDGVLNRDEGGYTHRPEDLAWMLGAREGVRAVNDAGWLAVVVTNQSGVGRGFYEASAVEAFHTRMQAELAQGGAWIDAVYACFHHAEALHDHLRHPDHPDRKPNPGMILRAARELGIDLAGSMLIGDRDIDMEAARRAGVRGVLYRGDDLGALVRAVLADAAPGDVPARPAG